MLHCKRCYQDRESPFCPVCGERLTGNPFIGHGARELAHSQEDASREMRHATDKVREIERKYEAELKEARKYQGGKAEVCRQLSEALDWAKLNHLV